MRKSYFLPKNLHIKIIKYQKSLFILCGGNRYRKIPKISPGAYIFQRPFLRGLFLEGPIFGEAYVRREICVSKSIGLACSGKEIYHFCLVLLCIRQQIPSTSPPGGLYSEGRFNLRVFWFWGAYIWRGFKYTWRCLFSEFYRIFKGQKYTECTVKVPVLFKSIIFNPEMSRQSQVSARICDKVSQYHYSPIHLF